MPKRKSSAAPSRRSKPKHSRLGQRLIAAAKEALAYARGEIDLPSYEIVVPESVDVASIRRALRLSQTKFAARFGLDVTALHAWEQGRRRPDRAARVLLLVIAREPEAVRRALAA